MRIAIASANVFTQGSPDKNGLLPLILIAVAGALPFKRTISGTVALNSGIKAGELTMLGWENTEADPQYGEQTRFTRLGSVSPMEAIEAVQKLGAGTTLPDSVKEPAADTTAAIPVGGAAKVKQVAEID